MRKDNRSTEERFVVFDTTDGTYLRRERQPGEWSNGSWWSSNVRDARRYTEAEFVRDEDSEFWRDWYLRIPVGIALRRDPREVFIAAHKAFATVPPRRN